MKSLWNKEFSSEFVKSLREPFCRKDFQSNKTKALIARENDLDHFIKRITPQIIEVYRKGLPYKTPEEWDDSFKTLGGGQSRRTSTAILERISWDQFIYHFEKITKELDQT